MEGMVGFGLIAVLVIGLLLWRWLLGAVIDASFTGLSRMFRGKPKGKSPEKTGSTGLMMERQDGLDQGPSDV